MSVESEVDQNERDAEEHMRQRLTHRVFTVYQDIRQAVFDLRQAAQDAARWFPVGRKDRQEHLMWTEKLLMAVVRNIAYFAYEDGMQRGVTMGKGEAENKVQRARAAMAISWKADQVQVSNQIALRKEERAWREALMQMIDAAASAATLNDGEISEFSREKIERHIVHHRPRYRPTIKEKRELAADARIALSLLTAVENDYMRMGIDDREFVQNTLSKLAAHLS